MTSILSRSPIRRVGYALAVAALVEAAASGCAPGDSAGPTETATPTHQATATLAPAESGAAPSSSPSPGATVAATVPTPAPRVPADTRVIALASGAESAPDGAAVRSALTARLASAHLDWREVAVGHEYNEVERALTDAPDLVVIVGTRLDGPVDILSASWLDQRIIILGSEIAEPTDNVSSVIWPGAEDRAALEGDRLAFTNAATWAGDAVDVALAAYLAGTPSRIYRLGPTRTSTNG